MKKLDQKTRKSANNSENEEQKKTTVKKERGVFLTLAINAAKALVLLVVVIFVVNILLGLLTRHGSNRNVPDLVGYSTEQAVQLLKEEDLELVVSDTLFVPVYEAGAILEQRPSAGEDKVKAGRKIYVTINAEHQRKVKVPYVTGLPLRQAVSNIMAEGLEIERLSFRSDITNKYVLDEILNEMSIDEESNLEVYMGTELTLVVGTNGESNQVPNVVGKTLREAKSLLWGAGFNIGTLEYDAEMSLLDRTDAVVATQSPAAQTRASNGRAVSLTLTYGL
ncbi:MAG: PASTA domain-containing protein [Tidjanibacter sp.]|nr:PASTA domain-containing protein [Tidjanibacter sp.]